jgi:hypothetical protein
MDAKPAMPDASIIDNDRAPAPRFLVVDRRVPEAIRQLLDEAEGCLNMSFVVGGSACVRRAIRQMFEFENVEHDDFGAGLLALGEKHPAVAPTLFQIMNVLGNGDDPLHGDALKALIATFKAVLYEIYVLGGERVETLAYLSELVQALDRASAPPANRRPSASSKPKSV